MITRVGCTACHMNFKHNPIQAKFAPLLHLPCVPCLPSPSAHPLPGVILAGIYTAVAPHIGWISRAKTSLLSGSASDGEMVIGRLPACSALPNNR